MSLSGRSIAFDVLCTFEKEGGRVDRLLDEAGSALEPRERGLAREIVFGVVRQRGTLRHIASRKVKRSWDNVEVRGRVALYIGLYQLLYLATPDHAAVSATVDLVKGPQRRGFVNAILRGVSRSIAPADPDTPETNPRRILPLWDGRSVLFTEDVFPDPVTKPERYLARTFSFPNALASRWIDRYGFGQAIEIALAQNAVPPLTLRSNPLHITRDDLLERLKEEGVDAQPGESPQTIVTPSGWRFSTHPLFESGGFSIQDETSQRVSHLLAPGPTDRILDVCAAPGGKSTHTAELQGDKGTVIAQDVDDRRLALATQSAGRLGITSVKTLNHDALNDGPTPTTDGPFDGAIVDPPCSNSGVLRRRVEARWRFPNFDFTKGTDRQVRFLRAGMTAVRPGGTVVYSVCSIEPEEGREVVDRAIAAFPKGSWVFESQETILPHIGGPDGGYLARLLHKGKGK